MIYLTGDTHGDLSRLTSANWPKGKSLSKRDYLIILGDFGVLWNPKEDSSSKYWLNWLSKKPWTTLFLDGNHENFDLVDNLQTIDKFDSKVGRAIDGVYHLRRGHVYTIEGITFFAMGGAASIDKAMRVENISWWAREQPSDKELELARYNLKAANHKIDYVLTHTCPTQVKNDLLSAYNYTNNFYDPLEAKLSEIEFSLEYKHWYFGHFHKNITLGKFTCLYEDIIFLEEFN
jgi:hypothetical protein